MWCCKLCANVDEWIYTGYLCSKCIKIKNLIRIYGVESINETLTYVYVRDPTPIKSRTEVAVPEARRSTRSKTKEETGITKTL